MSWLGDIRGWAGSNIDFCCRFLYLGAGRVVVCIMGKLQFFFQIPVTNIREQKKKKSCLMFDNEVKNVQNSLLKLSNTSFYTKLM